MQSFLEKLGIVRNKVSLSVESKAMGKRKLAEFMDASTVEQKNILAEFEQQESTAQFSPIAGVTAKAEHKKYMEI
jgi:hypothetical protein